MKKLLLLAAAATLVLAGCKKDNNDPEPNTVVNNDQNKNKDNPNDNNGKQDPNNNPSSLPNFLKACINRDAHPIFKFSGAIDVNEFHNNTNGIKDTVSKHFDEIVAGNAMKYGSVVNGSGAMNFDRVKQFCNDAKAASLSIFGHTLAWHSQQQPGYLLGLMADKELEVPESEQIDVVDLNNSLKGLSSWNYWHDDFKKAESNVDFNITTEDEGIRITNNLVANPAYAVQYVVADNIPTKQGKAYDITLTIKASKATDITVVVGGWSTNNNGTVSITDEWQDIVFHIDELKEGSGHVMLQSGTFVGDIYLQNVKITHKGSGQTVPLTDDEKRDALTSAMDQWIKGMMDATDGFVKAWDVVNEAIAGGGNIDGYYTLQHSSNPNDDEVVVKSGNFFWQDYMGDIEYVRTAVASARKHFKGNAADLKLFINDYNLESTWDDNKKLKSLIYWIEKWEADGVTKIDGIGTQMHISCYENESFQKSAEEHIVKMFQLMAATGKLVRVSELDMGYIRGNSTAYPNPGVIGTSQVTAAEHKKMANFYKYIIQKYFEIVPAAQQYGICQWCLTDAPGNLGDQGGWRPGQPVGIWTQGFKQRKEAFKGFAEGLAEKK